MTGDDVAIVKAARALLRPRRGAPGVAAMFPQPGFPGGEAMPAWLQQQPPPAPMLGSGGLPFAPPVAPSMAMAPLPSATAGVSVQQAHSRHIWVGNLVNAITEAELHAAFSRYGAVDGVSTYTGRNYAFVNMKARRCALLCVRGLAQRGDTLIVGLASPLQTVAGAVAAIGALAGAPIGGPALRLEFAKTGTPSRIVCVTNLSRAFTRDQWAAQFAVRPTRHASSDSITTAARLHRQRASSLRVLRPLRVTSLCSRLVLLCRAALRGHPEPELQRHDGLRAG